MEISGIILQAVPAQRGREVKGCRSKRRSLRRWTVLRGGRYPAGGGLRGVAAAGPLGGRRARGAPLPALPAQGAPEGLVH